MEEDDLDLYEYEILEVTDLVQPGNPDGLDFNNVCQDVEQFDWRRQGGQE